MKSRTKSYRGEGIQVSYDAGRCIHAAECVRGLPQVFDPERRPWIDPARASPEEVTEAVRQCPTGALHYELADGPPEAPAKRNTVSVAADGPLYLSGEIHYRGPGGEELRETRLALCRCGDSANKPFCDNSHQEAGFRDPGSVTDPKLAPLGDGEGGGLRITGAANGPLLVEGPMELRDSSGETIASGRKGALCRCGASANKPFCDGSHVAIGFEAES